MFNPATLMEPLGTTFLPTNNNHVIFTNQRVQDTDKLLSVETRKMETRLVPLIIRLLSLTQDCYIIYIRT